MKYLAILARILEAIANAVNISKKKKYADDPADAVANNPDGVQQSDKSFSDLAGKTKRNKAD